MSSQYQLGVAMDKVYRSCKAETKGQIPLWKARGGTRHWCHFNTPHPYAIHMMHTLKESPSDQERLLNTIIDLLLSNAETIDVLSPIITGKLDPGHDKIMEWFDQMWNLIEEKSNIPPVTERKTSGSKGPEEIRQTLDESLEDLRSIIQQKCLDHSTEIRQVKTTLTSLTRAVNSITDQVNGLKVTLQNLEESLTHQVAKATEPKYVEQITANMVKEVRGLLVRIQDEIKPLVSKAESSNLDL